MAGNGIGLLTLTDVAGVYNTLSVMKDMGRNTMSGAPAQKWLTLMPSTGGRMKME